MQAAVITVPGEPPVVADHPEPRRSDGQCVVRVVAAPITPLDLLCASGTSYFGRPSVPYVPGVQGVGVVAEPVPGLASAGSRVWFPTSAGIRPGDGSLAPFAAVDAAAVVELPDDVADTDVAALGLSAMAAWVVLTDVAQLAAGEQVLVLGAGGVVGQVAVQAARLLGARRVVAACRSTAARERALAAGADAVVPLTGDADVDTLTARYAEALDGAADVVVDPLCGVPATAAVEVLAAHGRLVNLGSSAGPTITFSSATLRSRSARILGYTNADLSAWRQRDALLEVLGHAAAGRLRVAHEVVPLAEVSEAWVRQRDGKAAGRIVVQCTARR